MKINLPKIREKLQTFWGFLALSVLFLGLAVSVISMLERQEIRKKAAPSPPPPTPQAQATLSLEPAEATVKLGQTFGVGINIEIENGKATGVEATLTFNPTFLEVLDGDKEEEGLQAVELGFFEEYLGNKVDNQEGEIIVSGINMTGEQFSQGTIGTILFRAKKIGETEARFVFASDEKGESDVAAPGGEDILTKTISGKYTIK